MRILFVCLGNICRSPLAEGVMRHLVAQAGLSDQVEVDSVGTGGWHVGEAPDPRSSEVARDHGVSLSGQRARQLCDADYLEFDLILAMDGSNLRTIEGRAPNLELRAEIALFLAPPRGGGGDVPDPYYGGERGFEDVYQMVLKGCTALLGDAARQLR